MAERGLQPVANPSAWLLGQRGEGLSGSAIGITAEGLRPLLVEVQALVSTAVYGTPQRSCTGFDTRRLNMLLAVLEKRCGFHLASKDVFLNVTGGLRVDDPALDLAVCAAILSSQEDRPIPPGVAFAGEVGLGGELRPIARMDARVLEAGQLGFDYVWGAKTPGMPKRPHGVHFVALDRISQVVDNLF
jgi:DNA repair protein RadA/Sms